MDSILWGSSIHGIFQARVLEWAAISFSRGASQPRDRTLVSHIASKCFYRLSHQGKPGNLFLPGLKPGTFHMWGECDNHYTTETGQREVVHQKCHDATQWWIWPQRRLDSLWPQLFIQCTRIYEDAPKMWSHHSAEVWLLWLACWRYMYPHPGEVSTALL